MLATDRNFYSPRTQKATQLIARKVMRGWPYLKDKKVVAEVLPSTGMLGIGQDFEEAPVVISPGEAAESVEEPAAVIEEGVEPVGLLARPAVKVAAAVGVGFAVWHFFIRKK